MLQVLLLGGNLTLVIAFNPASAAICSRTLVPSLCICKRLNFWGFTMHSRAIAASHSLNWEEWWVQQATWLMSCSPLSSAFSANQGKLSNLSISWFCFIWFQHSNACQIWIYLDAMPINKRAGNCVDINKDEIEAAHESVYRQKVAQQDIKQIQNLGLCPAYPGKSSCNSFSSFGLRYMHFRHHFAIQSTTIGPAQDKWDTYRGAVSKSNPFLGDN